MKQVFATAAVAGVTSAFSIREMYNKMVYGGTYRYRSGVDDPDGSKVIAGITDDLGYSVSQTKQPFEWEIDLRSIVNEDSGETILVMTHKLTGKILHKDTLIFNVEFTTTTDTTNSVIAADNARCTMSNDTRNT